jgi:hypothetical protein
MSDTRQEHEATIARLAAEAFASHQLTAEGEGRWLCAQPKGPTRAFHWFRVITAPYVVIVCGDLGDGIFECSDRDSLTWLRGASEGAYLRSKLRCCDGGPTEFLPGEAVRAARAWLTEVDEDGKDHDRHRALVSEAEQSLKWGDLHQWEWSRLVQDYGLDVDAHAAGTVPSSRALWLTHALHAFVRLYEAGLAAAGG